MVNFTVRARSFGNIQTAAEDIPRSGSDEPPPPSYQGK